MWTCFFPFTRSMLEVLDVFFVFFGPAAARDDGAMLAVFCETDTALAAIWLDAAGDAGDATASATLAVFWFEAAGDATASAALAAFWLGNVEGVASTLAAFWPGVDATVSVFCRGTTATLEVLRGIDGDSDAAWCMRIRPKSRATVR
eukprot:1044312-Amphidinium_carterae.2